jgi:hypothetical protein
MDRRNTQSPTHTHKKKKQATKCMVGRSGQLNRVNTLLCPVLCQWHCAHIQSDKVLQVVISLVKLPPSVPIFSPTRQSTQVDDISAIQYRNEMSKPNTLDTVSVPTTRTGSSPSVSQNHWALGIEHEMLLAVEGALRIRSEYDRSNGIPG